MLSLGDNKIYEKNEKTYQENLALTFIMTLAK